MREIKFRAWWRDTMEPIKDFTSEYCMEVLNSDEDNPFVWSESTGLKDRTGKEIYEGDILEQRYVLFKGRPPVHTRDVVEFVDGAFVCRKIWPIEGTICTGVVYYSEKNPEGTFYIIGNIHENPELLK